MTKRDTNIDLARIAATFLVIVLHVLGRGGVLHSVTPYSASYWTAWFLEILAYCAVNCFALISGYVMVNKSIKLKNLFGLWFQVIFYSVIITVLFFVFAPETRTLRNFVVSVLPIFGKQWWYVSAYFGLYFFIPVLNAFINNASQDTVRKVLIVFLFAICITDCVMPIDAFTLNGGYSVIWLAIMYLFGAYMNKYNLCSRMTALKSLLGFFVSILLTFLSKLFIYFCSSAVFGQERYTNILISFTSVTVVFASLFLVLFCLNVKLNKISKTVVGVLAPTTLGIYLIHVHPLIFTKILGNAFVSFAEKPFIIMALLVLVAVLLIFILCAIIEVLRIQLFRLIKVRNFCAFLDRIVNSFYLKVFKNGN